LAWHESGYGASSLAVSCGHPSTAGIVESDVVRPLLLCQFGASWALRAMNQRGWRVADRQDSVRIILACLVCEPNPFSCYGVPDVLTPMICLRGLKARWLLRPLTF
jgi:hypothetical protein